MKTKAAWMIIALVLVGWNSGLIALEHPREHPQEHPTQSKSEPPDQTKSKSVSEKISSDKKFQGSYEKVVKDYLLSESQKTGGIYTIKDEVANKEWKLKLLRVHRNKICMLQQGKLCFACADFTEVGGSAKIDLDFYANRSEDGMITVDKVLIHKVNEKPRFTYDQNNNMVPLKN